MNISYIIQPLKNIQMKKLFILISLFSIVKLNAQTLPVINDKSGSSSTSAGGTCVESSDSWSSCNSCCEKKYNDAKTSLDFWYDEQKKLCDFSKDPEWCKLVIKHQYLRAKARIDSLYSDCLNSCKAEYTGSPFKMGDATDNTISTSIYPNPAKDMLTVQAHFKQAGTASIIFYNVMGAVAKQITFEHNEGTITHSVDLESLSNGIYLVDFSAGDLKYQQKIVIAK